MKPWGEWIDEDLFNPLDDGYDCVDDEDQADVIVCRHGYDLLSPCLSKSCTRKPWGTLSDWQAEHAALTEQGDQ